MRVMTWNLWSRFGPWQQRREAIAATLAEVGPDVCGLQEVWSVGGENLAEDLAGRLGLHWRWAMGARGRAGTPGEYDLGNAILSRWPVEATAVTTLPVPAGEESRVALHARVATPAGPLPMCTTHLTHWQGASAIRVAQVRRLVEFVAANVAEGGYPPVLTGDFNSSPESDEIRLLGGTLTAPVVAGLPLFDAWRWAAPGDPGHTMDRRNPYHGEAILPDRRIDYIWAGLASRGQGRVQATRLAGDAPVAGIWPSDHFAVVTDLD